MTARQFIACTVAGAVGLTASGYLMFEIVLGDFYAYALNAGAAAGVHRESPLLWAVALGALSYSALITLAIATRPDTPTVRTGIAIGAVVGFLVWFAADFMLYGISNVLNLTSALVDPILEIVPSAVTGGVIAVVLRKVR